MASTSALAKQLADALYPDFADLFVLEDTCTKIEGANDLEDPAVIAALATCADLGPVQKRLIARSPAALAAGLAKAPAKLRATAAVLVQTLLAAAQRELAAGTPAKSPKKKKRPAFASPERLPALVRGQAPLSIADTDALLDQLAAGAVEVDGYTPASRAAFGRALVFGWLGHAADPKGRWAALAAAPFLDDDAAHAVASYARDIASRVGQSAKATVLVDVIAAMSTRGALAALDHLANHVTARAVQNAAQAALQTAAKKMDMSVHDLADRMMAKAAKPVDATAFARRLEQRMLAGSTMPMREFVESILQNPTARAVAAKVVFATEAGTFTLANEQLEDVAGKAFEPPSTAEIRVAHKSELSAAERTAWSKRFPTQPFRQFDRAIPAVKDLAALRSFGKRLQYVLASVTELFALEPLGWKRGPVKAGKCTTLIRVLGSVIVTIKFRPGFSARTAAKQTISEVEVDGTKASPALLLQIARELELVGGVALLFAAGTL